MKIIVILKRTFDTEEKVTLVNKSIDTEGVEWIINPYDEYAIEEAILLKEKHGGEVTVVSFGDEDTEKQLRAALAMGADKAVLIENDNLDEVDQFSTTVVLEAYLKDQEFDIILGGNVSIDVGSGQVGLRLAEKLGIPAVTTITRLTINENKAEIERDVEGDVEVLEVSLPILVTCQQGLNEPRYPSLPGIMKAKKKPLEKLELDDLDLDEDEIKAKTKIVDIFLPKKKQTGRILQGEISEQAKELITLLRSESKVI